MAQTGRMIGEYKVGKQIGSGSFSVVWHARHQIHGTEVAIKEISMSRLNKKLQDSLMSEICILKHITHPNIIRLYDIIQVPGTVHLVLEFCRGGDLFMYIQRHGRVPEATAKHFMQQLATGLKVLRDNNLVHRDLKPQNLLLSANDSNSVLKIADFGFARSLQPRGLAETLCGSPLYMAPEIMQLQKYDAKADLWSVGTILYQLVTGKTPFTGSNQIQLLQNIIKAKELCFPPDIKDLSSECVDLCQKLLRRNPVERLTFDEFFNHPYLHHDQLSETSRHGPSVRRMDYHPLSRSSSKTTEESSPDDCLPFLLDDDSSGPDGSPSYLRKTSSMKTSYGFSPDFGKEAVSPAVKCPDNSSRHGTTVHRMQTSGFRINSSKPANQVQSPLSSVEQISMKAHSRAVGSVEFIDQDYVLVSGPPLDVSFSPTNMSRRYVAPTKSDFPLPASTSVGTRSSAPVPIVGPPSRNAYFVGSLDSQCSAPSGTSHGSLDAAGGFDQPASDTMTRLNSLRECAVSIKELMNDMIEAGKHLEAFSIQLLVLAVWKQALHICHTQAVSCMNGIPSQDTVKFKGSIDKMNISPDFPEGFDSVRSQVLEGVATEIEREFFSEIGLAEELAKSVEPGNIELPDALETLYQSALALGRHGAVDELMGDLESAACSYSKAVRLLIFLLVEAPSLILNPPFSPTNSDRFRLRNYINILNDRQGISRSQRLALLKPEDQSCPP